MRKTAARKAQCHWRAVVLVYLAIHSSSGVAGESTFVLSQTDERGAVLPNKAFCVEPQFSLYMTPERLLYAYSRSTNDTTAQAKKIYDQPLMVGKLQQTTGLSNVGDTRRLERFMQKLLKGEPVTVAAFGGSVTFGVGTHRPEMNGWLQRVFLWIKETFPHPGHKLLNYAISAAASPYSAPCVIDSIAGAIIDLAFVEFSFNDGEMSSWSQYVDDPSGTRRGIERIFRKVLQQPNRPAVMYYHFHPGMFGLFKTHYYIGIEDRHEIVCRFYGVTSLSMRLATSWLTAAQPDLREQFWFPESNPDNIHPTCLGMRVMADQTIGFLQDVAAAMLRDDRVQGGVAHPEVLEEELPEPLFEGNTGNRTERCLYASDFQGLVKQHEGWQWLGESVKTPMQQPDQVEMQWGWVSNAVGDTMLIQAPVEHHFPELAAIVGLGAWMSDSSAKHGAAQISCEGGCSCRTRSYHFTHPYPGLSRMYWKTVNVTLSSMRSHCLLRVTNIAQKLTAGIKLRVQAIMVSAELGFVDTWNHNCLDCGQAT